MSNYGNYNGGGQKSGNGNSGYGGGQSGGYQGKPKEKKDYPLPTNFAEAKAYKINFGKYKGQTLNQIAVEDEGLRYIAWLGDNCDGEKFADTYTALGLFLGEPAVKAAVAQLPANGGGRF